MKSICGYWALDGAPTSPDTLSRMSVAGVHSPSPHLESWQQHEIGFGSAWWSPQTGLKAPRCLVRHESTGCVVVADARLDNPAELRAALAIPAESLSFDRETDCAANLILHAWLRWGEDCVERIDGDFAFVIHDPRHQVLYLARDRMGVRPLYVHHVAGKRLVFGSTSHAVLAHPEVPTQVNPVRVADYLIECAGGGLEGADFTSTFHLAVERHPPRHVTSVNREKHALRQYWSLKPDRTGALPQTDEEWADALKAAMTRAVSNCMSAPGNVGSMLSGGLDSTSLAIIASEQRLASGHGPLPTFSNIDSSLPDCMETAAVRALISLPCFAPTLIDHADLTPWLPGLNRFFKEFDEPFDATMNLPNAQYLAAAAAGVDSMLDGIDGDTLFGAGNTIRRQIGSGHWIGAIENARGLARIYGGTPWGHLMPPLRSILVPRLLRQRLQSIRTSRRFVEWPDRSLIRADFAFATGVDGRWRRLLVMRSSDPHKQPQEEAAEAIQHTFPVAAMERYGRVAALHGVTPLHPFADRKLLELCVNMPDRQHLHEGWSKPMLRLAMRGLLPDSVRLRRDKQHLGWRLNQQLWERNSQALITDLQSIRHVLTPYVDQHKLDNAFPSGVHPKPLGMPSQLRTAAVLATWLGRI